MFDWYIVTECWAKNTRCYRRSPKIHFDLVRTRWSNDRCRMLSNQKNFDPFKWGHKRFDGHGIWADTKYHITKSYVPRRVRNNEINRGN